MNATQPDLRYARRLGDWRYIPDRLNQAGERLRGYLARDGATVNLSQTSEFLADLVRLIDALQAEFHRRCGYFVPPMPAERPALPGPAGMRPVSAPAATAVAHELMRRA